MRDRFFSRTSSKLVRGAHHQLDITASGFAPRLELLLVVEPMNFAIEQDGVIEFCNLTIEPQMNAANGPTNMLSTPPGQFLAALCRRHLRQKLAQPLERKSYHGVVCQERTTPGRNGPLPGPILPMERLHIRVKENA